MVRWLWLVLLFSAPGWCQPAPPQPKTVAALNAALKELAGIERKVQAIAATISTVKQQPDPQRFRGLEKADEDLQKEVARLKAVREKTRVDKADEGGAAHSLFRDLLNYLGGWIEAVGNWAATGPAGGLAASERHRDEAYREFVQKRDELQAFLKK